MNVFECYMKDVAAFRDPVIMTMHEFKSWTSSWATTNGSKYFQKRVSNPVEVREALAGFSLHHEIRDLARAIERELISYLWTVGKPQVERNLYSGNFDPYKIAKVQTSLAAGTFSEDMNIYRRTEFITKKRPRIVIGAGISWAHMWNDAEYIPSCMAAMLATTYAAQALQCDVVCFMGLDLMRSKDGIMIYNITDERGNVNESYMAPAFHRDIFRIGTLLAPLDSWEHYESAMAACGRKVEREPRNKLASHWNGGCMSGSFKRVGAYLDSLEGDFNISLGDTKSAKAHCMIEYPKIATLKEQLVPALVAGAKQFHQE